MQHLQRLLMLPLVLALTACAAPTSSGPARETADATDDRIAFFDLGTSYDAQARELRDRGQRRFASGAPIVVVVFVEGLYGETLSLTAHEIARERRDVRIAEAVLPDRTDGEANIVSQTFRYTVEGEYPVELLVALSVGDEQRFERITVLP